MNLNPTILNEYLHQFYWAIETIFPHTRQKKSVCHWAKITQKIFQTNISDVPHNLKFSYKPFKVEL